MSAKKLPEDETIKLLAPSDEALRMLRSVDFSSFNDSFSGKEDGSACEVNTDSEDPFDPNDLVGIENQLLTSFSQDHLSRPIPFETSTQFEEIKLPSLGGFPHQSSPIRKSKDTSPKPPSPQVNIKVEPGSLSSNSAIMSSPYKQVTATKPHQTLGTPPLDNLRYPTNSQNLFVATLLSPTLSPYRGSKRPRIQVSSIDTSRSLHTSAVLQEEMQAPKLAVKREKRNSMPNPTIQLATQRPVTPGEELQTENSEQKVVKPIILSREQERVLQLALQGKSIFFTGSAGTGKSVLLKAIIKQLKKKHDPGLVSVTASTGLAACNIGGGTVHSFAGIKLGNGTLDQLLLSVKRNRKAVARWQNTSVLIIDEVSMVDGRLFDKLDQIARRIRRKPDKPFGGIQIIICGDFYQLPPVNKVTINPDGTEKKDNTLFVFESDAWHSTLHSKVILKEVFRQKGDQKFIDMLNEMRNGYVSDETEREFRRLSRPLDCPAGIVPTQLYATRFEVESANNIKLNSLPGKAQMYESRDGGSLPPNVRAQMLSNFLAPSKLFLKEKAQVMCIKNFDSTLVNGSLGQVIRFVHRDSYMCEETMREFPDLTLEQLQKELKKKKIKLQLSQSMPEADEETLEEMSQSMTVELSTLLDNVFNFIYQSESNELSEAPETRESQDVDSAESNTLELAQRVNTERKMKFLEKLNESCKGEKYPLVRFLTPDGVTTRDVLIEPEIWEIVDEKTNEVLVSRVQLPLMLAWALSIHKSQGQTLQKVKIDLTRVFENGQAYVALSRAVSREGLQVINFRKEKVRAHNAVIEFYHTLSSAKDTEED